ncbi:MAG: hypothetical protein ABW217_04330 [Polyangiaceae bacterium]
MGSELHRVISTTCLGFACLLGQDALADGARTFDALQPGAFVTRAHEVPVRIVFVGYERQQIDEQDLLAGLPATYAPVVRYPRSYGLEGRSLGLEYRFDYSITYTDRKFDDRFFGFLAKVGEPGPLTTFQQMYNDQEKNVREVKGPVLYIDAPAVESYLSEQLASGAAGYTLVFVNWYNRKDFRFHVYSKTGDADPDTGWDFGAELESRKGIAWGGSYGRTWFYDASAGPESWTNNWIVDDDQTNYHVPPIWEYARGAYRKPRELSKDLASVARFVGIDTLFTTSPLYDPLITSPQPGGDKVVHITMLEGDPESSALDYLDTDFALDAWTRFQPYYDWQVGITHVDPIDRGAARALAIFGGTSEKPDCWSKYGAPFAQLFCYFDRNLSRYVPAYSERDFVSESFAFNITDDALGDQIGILGFAADNWQDGTQTYVFAFDTPQDKLNGYGFTITEVHEVGHTIGMSHPHDGYDSELGLEFGPDQNNAGPFEFVWSGDESHSVMHYFDVAPDFGAFDRDNLYRWEAAGYLNWANALLADVLARADKSSVEPLQRAEGAAARSLEALERWDYLTAATEARAAYSLVAGAAEKLRVKSAALTAALQPRSASGAKPRACTRRYPGL